MSHEITQLAKVSQREDSMGTTSNPVKGLLTWIQGLYWDWRWNRTLRSPDSIAYGKRMHEEIMADIASGKISEYLTLDELEKRFPV
jgi:hypothetical protein